MWRWRRSIRSVCSSWQRGRLREQCWWLGLGIAPTVAGCWVVERTDAEWLERLGLGVGLGGWWAVVGLVYKWVEECLAEVQERWGLCSRGCQGRCRSSSVRVHLDLRNSRDCWHRFGSSIAHDRHLHSNRGRQSLGLRLNTWGVGQVWAEAVGVSESLAGASTDRHSTSLGCTLAVRVPGSSADIGCLAHLRRNLPWSTLPRWKRPHSHCLGTTVLLVFCPRSDSKQQAQHMSVKVSKIVKSNKS